VLSATWFLSNKTIVTIQNKSTTASGLAKLSSPCSSFLVALLLSSQAVSFTNAQTSSKNQEYFIHLSAKQQVAVINTRFGSIVIELFDKHTPLHAENFRRIITDGILNGTTFHRVINNVLIQGGDQNSRDNDRSNDGYGSPLHTVPFEGGLPARRGSVVMVRAPDRQNQIKVSHGSQFYILLRDAPELTGINTVFGRVVIGLDVVENISQVPADQNNNPLEMVAMNATITSFERARDLSIILPR